MNAGDPHERRTVLLHPDDQPAPIATAAEADALVAHFIEVMDRLVGIVQQETELVRAGRLAQAGEC